MGSRTISDTEEPFLRALREHAEFDAVRGEWLNRDVNGESLRRRMADVYAWGIPNEAVLERLVGLSPVVEVGAGNGYWASRIESHGGEVVAIEPDPPEDTWTDITRGTHELITDYSDCSLLLCWPSFGSEWPGETVRQYDGDTLIYVGEGRGGVTGSRTLHRAIDEEFGLADEVVDIPQWRSVSDKAYIFKRS